MVSVAVLAAVGTIAYPVPGQRSLSATGSEIESAENDMARTRRGWRTQPTALRSN